MENQNVKRGRGRPRVFSDEERKEHKSNYIWLVKSGIVMCAEMVRTTKWLVNHVI